MSLGPGKYDDLCTKIRREAKAVGAAVIIVQGAHGNGFSVQMPLELTLVLPRILREMADEIEAGGPGA